MMAGFSTRYPDGLVVHSAKSCALASGRLVTTAQQARPGRGADGPGAPVFAVVDGRIDNPEQLAGDLGLPATRPTRISSSPAT